MNVDLAIQALERSKIGNNRQRHLTVEVFNPGSIGGTPTTIVKAMHPGMDWDSGKIIIYTEQPLTALTPDQVADITKSVKEGQSWHAYEREKKHGEKIKSLEAQRDELLATLIELRDTLKAVPEMQHNKYDSLGVRVNNIIAKCEKK